jgi:hypothetical protein
MLKFGFSSQSGGGVYVGLEELDEVGLLDADDVSEALEEAESDACSLMDASCELALDSLDVWVVMKRRRRRAGRIGR